VCSDAVRGLAGHGLQHRALLADRFVSRNGDEAGQGVELDHFAKFEGFADELYVRLGDLKPSLGDRADEAFGFEARNHFPDGAQGEAGEGSEFLLGDELPRHQPSIDEVAGKGMISLASKCHAGWYHTDMSVCQ
jgi:hypothetical protein